MHRTLKLALLAAVLMVSGCVTGERYHQDFSDNMKGMPTKVIVAFSREHANAKVTGMEREVYIDGRTTYTVSFIEDGKSGQAVYDEAGHPVKA
jgi:hypothetical protein